MSDLVRLSLDFEGRKVRMVGTAERPEWVASDVCAVLGLKNVTMALKPLDADERGEFKIVDVTGRPQEMLTVTESGLYDLIMRSRKPDARRFRRWVRGEVLPQIRRTGSYGPGEQNPFMERITAAYEQQGLILRELQLGHHSVRSEVVEIGKKVDRLEGEVRSIVRRRNLTGHTKRCHIFAVRQLGGLCPCCSVCKVIDENGNKAIDAEWDHYCSPRQAAVGETWLVCAGCNQGFRATEKRQAAHVLFMVYQQRRADIERHHSPQTLLPFRDVSA